MNDWLNFRHLYAFWMVARAGSFTRAAKQMHVAQSAVSAQVAALEEYLEEPLLVRAHRAVELTPAGQELMGHAQAIFAQSRAINALFRGEDRLRFNKTIRVGVVGGASRNFVYRLLDRHAQNTPHAHLSVSTGSYRELYESLRRFELDSIISLELPKKKHLAEVAYERLGESRMCIVATPPLIDDIRKKRWPERLDVYKFRHPFEVNVLGKHVQPLVDCELALRMDTDDIPLLRFFANSGRGVAILPRVGVLEDLDSGVVDAIELPRCPEVIIYGITMIQAHRAIEPEGGVSLWHRDE